MQLERSMMACFKAFTACKEYINSIIVWEQVYFRSHRPLLVNTSVETESKVSLSLEQFGELTVLCRQR